MSQAKRELGDNYTPAQEDYVAGRLPHQAKAALRAKEVRSWIAKHPGTTSFDVKLKFGRNCQLDWLYTRNLIKPDMMGGWTVVPL